MQEIKNIRKHSGKCGSIIFFLYTSGNDLFSVQSRGKQCAFMSLSALLTAQNIPLIDWSKTTFINNVSLQGDKMYLQALNDGFVVLEPGHQVLVSNSYL